MLTANAPEGGKTCSKCGRMKPVVEFWRKSGSRDGLHSWCKTCGRIACGLYRRTGRYRETYTRWANRPDVRRRKREIDRARAAGRRSRLKAYRATARARLLHCRRQARWALRRATTEEQRRALLALIAQHDATLHECGSCSAATQADAAAA